ncbi:MAG: TM2 domain-containing protein [Planctomycetaceae bacterium]|jgi:hypothetical protein|nr:TM2 domain-containing protein [Planctomycetaceae bacterium]
MKSAIELLYASSAAWQFKASSSLIRCLVRRVTLPPALLAFFLGWTGAHKFYCGSWGWGLVILITNLVSALFFAAAIVITSNSIDSSTANEAAEAIGGCIIISGLLFLPIGIANFVDFIRYLAIGQNAFDNKYNNSPNEPFKW